MNKIQDEKIYNLLQDYYTLLIDKYNEKQIFGLFVYGKANYGFAESINDVHMVFLYLPTFEEMCSVEPNFLTEDSETINDIHIKKIDIRKLYNFASKQDGVMMEALFSDYQIINPRYAKVFKKYFLINKEIIFHCDPEAKVNQIVEIGHNAIVDYVLNKNREKLFQACFLRIACRLFLNGVSCENCINLKKDYHISYLWQVLKGEIDPDINEIYNDYDIFIEEAKEYQVNSNCKNIIAQGIKEILIISLTDIAQTEDFKNKLTDLEKQALEVILDNLADQYEGNISISQLVNMSNISRPVFKSVLDKMKTNLIAEIENKGVKGTYVKIIDGNILSK